MSLKVAYKNKKQIKQDHDAALAEAEKQIMREIDETLLKRTYKKYGVTPPPSVDRTSN